MSKIIITNIKDISDKEYEEALKRLSPQKLERVMRIRSKEDKLRSVAGDISARKAVAAFTHKDIDSIVILEDDKGKPFYEGIYLSISHSEDYAVCAVDSQPIGIDIERIRPNLKRRIIRRVCLTKDEKVFADCDNFKENIIIIWTIKEACFKALEPQPRFISDIKLNITNDSFVCNGISNIKTEKFCTDYIITTAFCSNI